MLEDCGWAVAPNPREHDLGTDLWVSPRDERRYDLGLMLGMQVKNGESEFDEYRTVEGRAGWWFRDSRAHFEYWLHHAIPHVVILRNRKTQHAYWARVDEQSVIWTGRDGKLFVPEDQLLTPDALSALIDIAASVRPKPAWSGSAWTGAPDLPPADLLRYALLAPRLVAPHPNAGVKALGAHEAIALLTAGRFGELDRYGLLEADASRTGWKWDFFAAVLQFATSGTLDQLHTCAQSALEPNERAAAAAVLAAALVEDGDHEEALAALEEPLGADDNSPIDHAWLQVHRARSLTELGDTAGAIELAVTVQGLPALHPDDVTATAIAGSGASLVFRASDLFSGDLATTISAGDTETSWWRAQATSWGLGSLFDESFRRWNRNQSEVRYTRDTGENRLRGVSLVAGFTALHEAWCYTASILAKADLMSGHLDAEDAASSLAALRQSGDAKAIKVGVAHLLESGPAEAVSAAADQVDLDKVAHTDAHASLELLVRGADVLSTPTADAAAGWAMQGDTELSRWEQRVRPTFIMEFQRAELLSVLVPVVSATVSAEIREHTVALPILQDQGSAHAWAAVVAAVPDGDWTDHEVAQLLSRSGDHKEFENALKPLGLRNDPARRQQNDDRLRAGDLQAMIWAGSITDVPKDAAEPLSAGAATAIRDGLAQVRSGMYTSGNRVDPARILLLLNTHFPDSADWLPIIELLSEPLAHRKMLNQVFEMIEAHADKIDEPARSELAEALARLIARAPAPDMPLFGGDSRAAASGALDALRPGSVGPAQWLAARDTPDRIHLILALARRCDPRDTDVLVALASDPDARIRAGVAAALSYWVVQDVSTAQATAALNGLLTDKGTRVARHVVSSWPDEPNDRIRPLAEQLTSHVSAQVRAAAARALEITGQNAVPES